MFSKLKNCHKCGRVFQTDEIGQKFCSRCRIDEEGLFLKAREYIYDNPDTNVIDVSEELDIEEELVLKWLRQGRLQLKGEGVGYPCDRCGTSIQTGRFCEKCQVELKSGFDEAFGMNKKTDTSQLSNRSKGSRMHIKR